MTNQDRIERLQDLSLKLVLMKRSIEKKRNLNSDNTLLSNLQAEIINTARAVDSTIGISEQVENEVIRGFEKYTKQNKMGINNQINCVMDRIEEIIEILNK